MDPEENIGRLWDRIIRRAARTEYPEAAVDLEAVRPKVALIFRALGGDPGLSVEAAAPQPHGARRSWLQRLAGSQRRMALAWADDEALRLPERLDLFPDSALNRDLYLWLAALAALDQERPAGRGWYRGPELTARVLEHLPGMRPRYERLVAAYLPLRPDPQRLPADEAAAERAVRQALEAPRDPPAAPVSQRPPFPVPLWLHPDPPVPAPEPQGGEGDGEPGDPEGAGETRSLEDRRRRRGQRVPMPERDTGLLLFPFDSILSWAEYLNVDRPTEDDDDLDNAANAADDLDMLSLARDNQRSASRLRFDLDLPSAAQDDTPLGSGIRLPEWDYRRSAYRPHHCRLQPLVAQEAPDAPLPDHLRRTAHRLRAQFQQLNPAPMWHKAQTEGTDIDLDAYQHFVAERAAGYAPGDPGLYLDRRTGNRELACLLLADLSLSTDTWISDEARIIDVIRDSLFLFSESLTAAGDAFALYGFSSRKRDHVRFHVLKEFGEPYGSAVRGRLSAIKPGFYTRMGAALRQSVRILEKRPAEQRLLLLLTDGKPNDMDQYEARYGVEDTRAAVREARAAGLQPFCVTIDREAEDYLPHLFGSQGFVVIRSPEELPSRLPKLYAQLTQ